MSPLIPTTPMAMTGWWSALYVVDVLCFGLGWNLLSGHSTDRGVTQFGHLGVEAAAGAALIMVAATFIAMLIAVRTPRSIRDRVRVLDARHRGVVAHDPAWFRTGIDLCGDRAAPPTSVRRTLLRTTWSRRLAAAIPFGGGAGLVIAGGVGMWLSATGTPLADELVHRLGLATCLLTLAHLAARRGKRTLVCEMDDKGWLADAFERLLQSYSRGVPLLIPAKHISSADSKRFEKEIFSAHVDRFGIIP